MLIGRGPGVALIASAAVIAGAAATGPASSAPVACPAAPDGMSQTFSYSGTPQPFTVPAGVTRLTVAVEGGHGGQYGDSSRGGAAGGVDATIPVEAGECLTVHVGGYGGKAGGFGLGKGGAGGRIGGGSGHSGAGGGGASSLSRGGAPLVVAGGGGGGGGDGASQHGGNGGDGGAKPARGDDASGASGGAGGRGGAAPGTDGQSGESDDRAIGAGGGGGGGSNGGARGSKGRRESGGGGAGGGRSRVAEGGGASAVTYFTSTRPCPYGKTPPTCHGAVTLSWSPTGGAQPPVPLTRLVRVLSLDVARAASDGVPVSVAAGGGGSVRLELLLGRIRVARQTVPAQASRPTRLRLRPSAEARRALRRADSAAMSIRAIQAGETTTQRLALR